MHSYRNQDATSSLSFGNIFCNRTGIPEFMFDRMPRAQLELQVLKAFPCITLNMNVNVRSVYFLFYPFLFTVLPLFRILFFSTVFSPEARSIRGNSTGVQEYNLKI